MSLRMPVYPPSKITAPAQDFFKEVNTYLPSSFSIGRSTTEELEEERRYRKKLAKSEALTLTLTDWF